MGVTPGIAWMALILLVFTPNALAAPAGKGNVTITTIGRETVFASEPHGRGTVGILISCTATFIFCIWTAVHPNVVPGCSGSQRLYYKAVLMIVSIVVPEGLLICAIGEYRTAKRVRDAWRNFKWDEYNDAKDVEKIKRKVDMKVAFFIVMGGFIVDEIKEPSGDEEDWVKEYKPPMSWRIKNKLKKIIPWMTPEEVPPPRPYRAILTPTGFIYYMQNRLIDERSFEYTAIIDKGKASTFGKFLAVIQALWLVVNSITRWRAELPLSLLEVHVLIHVVRTAIIYALWWKKPLDVNEPIRIQLMKRGVSEETSDPKSPTMTVISATSSTSHLTQTGAGGPNPIKFNPLYEFNSEFGAEEEQEAQKAGQGALQYHAVKSRVYRSNEPNFITIQSPRTFIAFHNKALYDIVIQVDVGERKGRDDRRTGYYLHLEDGSGDEKKRILQQRTFILLLEACLICLTGTLHAAAWNKLFPSNTEKWLWRMSSLAMCYCCLGIFLIANFTEYEQDLIAGLWKFHLRPSGFFKSFSYILDELDGVCLKHANKGETLSREQEGLRMQKRRTTRYVLHQVAIWLTLCFVGFYFFSVGFITVESYLSLREVSSEMFLTPSWADYWPHL